MTPYMSTGAARFQRIDGLQVRYCESDRDQECEAMLLSPLPESLFAYRSVWGELAKGAHLVAIDLPGFGHSEGRTSLLAPAAMGEFLLHAADVFRLEQPHVIAPK